MSHAEGRLAPPMGDRSSRILPPLAGDEHIILRSQGGYKNNIRPIWKLGHLFLTNQRLIFSVPTGIVWEAPLSSITSIETERQRYIAGREKDCIVVGYEKPALQRVPKASVIMRDLEVWRQKLFEMTLLEIDQETVDRVMQELDPQSREIVGYLWENRHATIDELAELIAASTHMDVLLTIKRVINPTAERITGSSLLAFERSKVDPLTGEKVLFSWWIIASARIAEANKAGALVDVFDEGERIDVVAELAGVKEEDIVLEVARDRLTLSVQGPEGKYHQEIALPAEVRADTLSKSYTNNVLAVSLEKLGNGGRH